MLILAVNGETHVCLIVLNKELIFLKVLSHKISIQHLPSYFLDLLCFSNMKKKYHTTYLNFEEIIIIFAVYNYLFQYRLRFLNNSNKSDKILSTFHFTMRERLDEGKAIFCVYVTISSTLNARRLWPFLKDLKKNREGVKEKEKEHGKNERNVRLFHERAII